MKPSETYINSLTVQEQLAALRDTYARGLPEKLERIALAWQEIRDNQLRIADCGLRIEPTTDNSSAHINPQSAIHGSPLGLAQLSRKADAAEDEGRRDGELAAQRAPRSCPTEDHEHIRNPQFDEALETLHRGAHSLAGSGASMGFAALSVAARTLEVYVQGIVEARGRQSTLFSVSQIAEVDMLLDALLHAAQIEKGVGSKQAQPADDAQRLPRAPESIDVKVPIRGDDLEVRPGVAHNEGDSKLVFLLEQDPELAQDLAAQISHFGYQVRVFSRWDTAKEAIGRVMPIALIADLQPTTDTGRWTMDDQSAIRNGAAQCPLIFISECDDMSTRLQAVRLGGTAYFTKPVGVDSIVSKLDEFISPQASDPYRILVIDDEPELAGYHASILESAGMLTMVINDPMQTLTALLESKPDLILMDMHMPGCTGLELAGVIRQQEAYVSVPIVYLSAETDFDKQLAAMRLGGDSFLTKPIRPEHLISAVRGRVERLRVLRSFMVRDSLTGLLNHTVIKEQLALEVARTMRAGREGHSPEVCFALIDIDHFKLVNDTYGHATGDRVIKSISRLLQQRLRKSDMVGRYGGEEFAIILPNTKEAEAEKLLNELRNGFSQVRHQGPGEHPVREFYVTFSAGVAQFSPQFADANQLSSAADKALYEAKALGRNCVAVA